MGCCFAATTNSYDKYGSKTGSYKTNGSTVSLIPLKESNFKIYYFKCQTLLN